MLILKDFDLQKIKIIGLVIMAQLFAFIVGAYSAHEFWPKQLNQNSNITNYTTKPPVAENPPSKAQPVTAETVSCPIKGNISSKSKIYHLAGGAFYERTTAEICFATESEAQAAGFTKSSR